MRLHISGLRSQIALRHPVTGQLQPHLSRWHASISGSLTESSILSTAAASPDHITRVVLPRATNSIPNILEPTAPSKSEPYRVTRTASHQLPVYQLTKSGGNLKITRIRKISGNAMAFKEQLEGFLKPRPKALDINRLTGHVIVKGWYKAQVESFLVAKGF